MGKFIAHSNALILRLVREFISALLRHQPVSLRKCFYRLPHAAFLIGTLKSPPVRAIRKSAPPEGRPQFSDLPGSLRPGFNGLLFPAIRPRLAQPGT
jgi:hypothetical protein